jgi:hypothetical protein
VRRLGSALVIVAVAGVVAACDHGAAMLVENQTDQDYIVRVIGNTFTSSQWVDGEVVTIAPANSKHVVYVIPFRGGLEPRRLDVVRPDCSPIYSESFIDTNGTYIVIDDNAKVSIRKEFPQNGDPAPPTDSCHTLPAASPSPS